MNWDYIGGFFDGEGTLYRYCKGFRVGITQANKQILEQIRDFAKLGNICEITKRKPHWSDAWVYFISKRSDVYKFLKKVEPKLIIKRKLAREAIIVLRNNLEAERERKLALKRKIKNAKRLRRKGLPYRAIGKELKIDFGYARRLIKFH